MATHLRSSLSVSDAENWLALSTGALLFVYGATRRSATGLCVAAASTPLLYRGMTGQWPAAAEPLLPSDDSRVALAATAASTSARPSGSSCRSQRSTASGGGSKTCPGSCRHLTRDRERRPPIALGSRRPGRAARSSGTPRSINEVENKMIAWRSLPGSDVVDGRLGELRLRARRPQHPGHGPSAIRAAGRTGRRVRSPACSAASPSQTIREDLRRSSSMLEAGETAQATAAALRGAGGGGAMKAVRYYGKEDIRVEQVADPSC